MPKQRKTDWKQQTLEDIAEINPRDTVASMPENMEVSFVPMAAISEITASITATEIRPLSEVRKGFTSFREGDVLFAKITPCMENGKVAIARDLANGLGFGSTEFHVIRPSSGISNRWVWYFLRNPATREYAAQNMTGSAGQQRVPTNFVRMLQIPVPPTLEKQERIADLLDEIENARRLCEQLQEEMERFISALFLEIFGDPETNPKEWNIVSLGDKESVVGFTYGTNVRCTEQPLGTPVLRIPNILRGEIDVDDLKYATLPLKEKQKLALQFGDVLVVRSNGNPNYIGRGAAYEGIPLEAAFASYLIRIRPVPTTFEGEYLSAWLRSPNGRRQLLNQAKTTAGQYNISTEGLKQLSLPRPPLFLQKQFVSIINEVRLRQKLHKERYQEMNGLLESLLKKIFTGHPQPVETVSPAQPQVTFQRTIWPKLSATQQNLWEASQTFTKSFKAEELNEQVHTQQGKILNSEYAQGSMELLEVLAVTIKENRGDVEKWRLPNDDTDPDVEV